MKAVRQVLENQRLRRERGWALLALEHAPVALGLLQAHLGGRERRLPGSILLERLRRDLETLRAHGQELPQTAEVYLANWLRAGYLVRTFPPGAPEEEYELSTEASRAIRFIESLERPRAMATETRLSLVIHQLQQLAEQTEADPTARLEALQRERARLDAQIEAVRQGRVETLSEERALEQVNEVTALARELLSDFRRVRDEFARIHRELREQIVENEGSRGEVLDKVFAGVDLVAESEAGRTFRAFWRLLTNPEQELAFEEALEKVLARDFARRLESRERKFLLRLTRELLDNGGEVHDVLQQFARGLKQFVQSQAYQEQRRLHKLLQLAQQHARQARERVRPASEIGTTLFLTSADLSSVAQWQLRDPGDEAEAGEVQAADEMALSLEAVSELLAHSEIDFRSLREQVERLLETRPQVSVAEVLETYPARQGLGSVVGLLSLASREGVKGEALDRVCWQGRDGVERCARIPRLYFVRKDHVRAG
ncbi:MAG TPA: DUF3375 domain-containing protein [Thiolapillus brandeum]|uniref:DUF3375 domain-containing protein n=1 Tax=Thiolapillus brandeum TaxID=1076588 RepID=A0A7C5N018_9GAMM|nr:DUF3375 domain-containing protein [Thiolapillus brandeum]